MRRSLFLLASLFTFSSFAANLPLSCPQASSTADRNFCSSFQAAASCRCEESGLPKGKCQNMNDLYYLMIARFGSIQAACQYQHDTSVQTCMDDWACYRKGGKDSKGHACSGTGKSC